MKQPKTLAFVSLCLISMSCGGNGWVSKNSTNDEGEKAQTSREGQAIIEDKSVPIQGSLQNPPTGSYDNAMANEPVMTGGSFLHCSVKGSMQKSGDMDMVMMGCGIYGKDEQKISLPHWHDYEIQSIRSSGSMEVMIAEKMPLESPWHWLFPYTLEDFENDKIRTTVFLGAEEYVFELAVKRILPKGLIEKAKAKPKGPGGPRASKPGAGPKK